MANWERCDPCSESVPVVRIKTPGWSLIPPDPVKFLSSNWELQSKAALYQVFCYSCLCLGWRKPICSKVSIDLPDVAMKRDDYQSLVSCFQLSVNSFAIVTELLVSDKSLDSLQTLLTSQSELVADTEGSVWDLLETSNVERTRTAKLLRTLYRRAEPQSENAIGSPDASDLPVIKPADESSSSGSSCTSSPSSRLSKPVLEVSKLQDNPPALGTAVFPTGKGPSASPVKKRGPRGI